MSRKIEAIAAYYVLHTLAQKPNQVFTIDRVAKTKRIPTFVGDSNDVAEVLQYLLRKKLVAGNHKGFTITAAGQRQHNKNIGR